VDKIRIMIIDEEAFFKAGVCQALSQQSYLEIVDCDLTQDPLGLIEANPPDVVILGFDLATFSGLELSRKIARHYPNIKVIMLSPDPNDEGLFEVIKTAPVACLSKNTTAEELTGTIRRAYNGEYLIDDSLITRPIIARHVLNQFQHMSRTMEAVTAPITSRETQILNYVAEGNSNKQIARILGISEQTIKNHVSAILRKLHANDRAHAVGLAIRKGWISAERKYEDLVAVS
jgi:DNA-binding NarL/FixJ family response regulator